MLRHSIVAAVAVVIAAPALGHDTWLLPAAFKASPDDRIVFTLTSGMAFPAAETRVTPDRVQQVRARLGDAERRLVEFAVQPKALEIHHAFGGEGLAAVWASSHSRTIDIEDTHDVEHYLEEIGATAALRARWAALRDTEVWRETYVKHVKTYVALGETPTDDETWRTPVGLPLEIIPLHDPARMRAGEQASFRVYKNGAPLSGISVGLITAGSEQRVLAATDRTGRVSFKLEKAGPVLVTVTDLRRTSDDAAWESDFSTLTLGVGEEEEEEEGKTTETQRH